MKLIEQLYINFTSLIFGLIYILINKASIKKIFLNRNSFLVKKGFKEFNNIKLEELNNILSNISERASKVKNIGLIGSHDISRVGNEPFSIESLSTKEEIIIL